MNKIKLQQFRRYAGYTLAGLLITLLLVAGGCAVWLWGWTWKGTPQFHESWTPEERTAIAEFDDFLKNSFVNGALKYMGMTDEVHPVVKAFLAKTICGPVSVQLRQIAETGNAAVPGVEILSGCGATPALLASQTAHFGALKALIRHGANPNAGLNIEQDDSERVNPVELPLTPLISGNFIHPGKNVPWEERRVVADFLIEHGADINADRIIGLCCCLPYMREEKDSAPWFWAMEKGYRATGEHLQVMINHEGAQLELIEAMLKSNPGVTNAVHYGRTPLQYLAEIAGVVPHRLAALEPILKLLLQYGADPTRLPSGDAEYDEPESRLPLQILRENPPGRSRRKADVAIPRHDTPEYAIWQRMCELLEAHSPLPCGRGID